MPAPNSSFIVENPPPLNTTVFPFGVLPLPAQALRDFAGLIQTQVFTPAPPRPDNSQRYEG